MPDSQWFFIGAGNMASSLVGGLIASDVSAADITVVDIDQAALDKIKQAFGVQCDQNIEQIEPSASVVIAVKPNIVETWQLVCAATL